MTARNTTKPAVSVLMPVHNAGRTVSSAIGSLQRQTSADWELLFLDDGSTDRSADMAAEFARRDARIRVLRLPRAGLVTALEAGLKSAAGRYLARMDADDVCLPDRLQKQADYLDRHPRIGLVGGLVEFGGDRQANLGYALHVDWLNTVVTPEQIQLNRFVESPFAHPSVMFRRELVERLGGYRQGPFPEDYELWLRWLDADVRMAKVPEPVLVWNDPPTRLSRTDPRYDAEAFYRIKAPYLARAVARTCAGRPLWIWGAGRLTRRRVEHLVREGIAVAGYLDIDPNKWGVRRGRPPVIDPTKIPPPAEAMVIGYVAKRQARELIRQHLFARGFVEGTDFWMAA